MIYYNEIDPFAAEWLRQLMSAGMIGDGWVDERSIEDVLPSDLVGFTQCHFFAGIGVWNYALRQAGWPDERPIWTGSCPCQPFSQAGQGGGFDDERHLWPHFHWLIQQSHPKLVIGEQVASKDGLAWLDLVQADLEASQYASGAVDICAAGFGAPHIRQRLYWMAYTDREGESGWGIQRRGQGDGAGIRSACERFEGFCSTSRLAYADNAGLEGWNGNAKRPDQFAVGSGRLADGLGNSHDGHLSQSWWEPQERNGSATINAKYSKPGPTNGFWRNADWLFGRDGYYRPVEPGTFPLADGITNRMGILRGYGNAINAEQAKAFIQAVEAVIA